MRIAIAVNCLVIEPRRYFVCGVFGRFLSRSAKLYPLLSRTSPFRATSTAPVNDSLSVRKFRVLSIFEAGSSGSRVGDGGRLSVAVDDGVVDTDGPVHPDSIRLSTIRLRWTI